MLVIWHTPVADGDGLFLLRVLLYSPGAPWLPGVPADHVSSSEVRVMVDNTAPVASISLDMGACQKCNVGDNISGKFTATGKHIWQYAISVLPASVAHPPVVSPATGQYPVLAAPGLTDATFALTTAENTTPAAISCVFGSKTGPLSIIIFRAIEPPPTSVSACWKTRSDCPGDGLRHTVTADLCHIF